MSLAKMMEGGEEKSWKDFGLDARLLHGIKRMKFKTPTLIQSSTIPLALAGKDVLARASTGSGKTAAYSLPMCHKLLQSKGEEGKVRGLVLVPSKELCNQVMQHYQRVLAHAEGALCVVDLSDIDSAAEWSNQRCEICVATPSTALTHANAGHVDLSALEVCVIDEADALLSHPTVKRLRCMYPTTTQSFLMSATLSPGVVKLKGLILNKPVVVKLQEEDDDEDEEEDEGAAPAIRTKTGSNPNITQEYLTYYNENEKYCYLYALVRFKQVEGKVLIFVDNIDKAYRLKLFLDKFSLRAAVLNADIPLNSRNHIVAQFNMGEYSFLIATDETMRHAVEEAKASKPKKGKKAKEDKAEYGVSRGIDFREVTVVVNFDAFELRTEAGCKSYIHRIGRTGRAGKSGKAITFLPKNEAKAEGFLPYLNAYLSSSGQAVEPHPFEKDNAEAMKLSYRTDDALQGIKKKMVKEAKVKELISEAVNSQTLKQYFVENPNDLAALKHIKPQKKAEQAAAESRAYVPTYLGAGVEGRIEHQDNKRSAPDSDSDDSDDQARKKTKRRKMDPLKSLKLAKAKPAAKKGGAKKKFVAKKKKSE